MARRTYALDEHFFDSIDTEPKAYFFGLLCADGYNQERRANVSLSLNATDRELVYALKRAVGYGGPIYRLTPSTQYANAQQQYRLTLCSRRLSNQLSRLGCGQKKSKTLGFPQCVPSNLVRHFIRGYFDGDGCVCVPRNRCPIVSVIGSRDFCDGLADQWTAAGVASVVKKVGHSPDMREVRVCRKASIVAAYRELYEGATVYLRRKRVKFEAAVTRANWVKPLLPPGVAKSRAAERHRAWVAANPEKSRQYRMNSRERRVLHARAYRAANPEKYLEYERRRAERMQNDPAYRAARLESRRRQHATRTATTALLKKHSIRSIAGPSPA